MASSYDKIPEKAKVQPSKFIVSIADKQIDEFRTLLRLSRIGPSTFENAQQNRNYGITQAWLTSAKEEWLEKFEWFVKPPFSICFSFWVNTVIFRKARL